VSKDQFSEFDAAYVLGVLSKSDAAAFEAHLLTCPQCQAGVDRVIGLPDMFEGVDEAAFQPDPAPPIDLLPRLLKRADRERRRRRWTSASLAALAAACLVVATIAVTRSAMAPTTPKQKAVAMTAIAPTAIHATAAVVAVAWGTKVTLHCTYDSKSIYPVTGDYHLVILTREGVHQDIGNWNVVPGKVTHFPAGTAVARSDIVSIAITQNGAAILQLKL
jgi:anti-sigma-K factor RskA